MRILAAEPHQPLSFVACVSDERVLQANLLYSPCLHPGTPHEVILVRGCPSAADGLNEGLRRASHPFVVFLHQDVYLPDGWDRRFLRQYRLAEQAHGPLGVAGVYGVRSQVHHSRSVGLPPEFYPSAERFTAKWQSRLPLATSCVHLDAHGRMRLS